MNPKTDREKRRFIPINEKQRGFIYSQKHDLLLSGAVRAGKSFIGCWKGLMLNLKYPGNRGFICRKENTSLPESTLFTLLHQVLPSNWIVDHNQSKGRIIHLTPCKDVYSTIIYGGLDKKAGQDYPTKIGSTQFGWVFPDETLELEKGDWDMLSTRLNYMIPRYTKEQNDRIPRQIFGATNPDAPNHWLYKFFFECTEEQKKEREVYLMTPYDNPYLPKNYIKYLEQTLTGARRQRLLFGKWVQAEGTIYESFDFSKHLVDASKFLPIKDYKAIYFGADSNFPLPRAAVLAGIRGDGYVDILDEFYQENAHVEDLIEWLVKWQKQREWTLYGYHDPSNPTAIDKINRTQGISCEKADNEVIEGISEVERHLSNNLIRINKTCVNMIREFQSYRWKKKGEEPVKKDDHLMDALRYLLQSIRTIPSLKVVGARIFK